MNSKTMRIVLLGILLGFAIYGILSAVAYNSYKNSPRGKADEYVSQIEKMYAGDTYGGSTPEETLKLFVDALKKGDVDLAAKYFLPDEYQKWRQYLAEMRDKNELIALIGDLQKLSLVKTDSERAFFQTLDASKKVDIQIVLNKQMPNEIWKISAI